MANTESSSVTPVVTDLTFEHHHSGLGVDTSRPRISWRFEATPSTVAAWVQTAYELEVRLSQSENTESFRIDSDQNVLVPWPARPLASRERAEVRVRVYGRSVERDDTSGGQETPGEWSAVVHVEAALLEASDFRASFIRSSEPIGPRGPLRPIRFRKTFELPDDFAADTHARLYITALGVFEAWINGHKVGDEWLAPGWTSYKHRLAYRAHDVSRLLRPGRNAICVEVAEGWYAGRLGFKGGRRFRYDDDDLGLFAQLEVHQKPTGSTPMPVTVVSDDSWSCSASPLLNSEIYDGETYDTRLERASWTSPDTSDWSGSPDLGTRIRPWPAAKLSSPDAAPVRTTETKPCQSIFKSKSGKTILDFGQNLVGKVLVRATPVSLAAGEPLSLRHAEVMEHGELGTRPLRDAKATDTIIGSGDIVRDWTPRFTFHGFRYVEVVGWPGDQEPSPADFEALVMHTDMKRRGYFECSNRHVNRLHENVVWSMRGNFLSLPTDCPQRDERLGWTGDLQVFAPTASFLYDTMGILSNWLQDLAVEQLEDGKGGIPPLVVPLAISSNWPHIAQAVWDDVAVLAPDCLYRYSADKALLERQFESMQAWLGQGVNRAEDRLWHPDYWQLSDWLDPAAPPEDPGNGRTDSILVANAYLVHTTSVFAELCKVLGKHDLAQCYAADAERLKTLFQRRYITAEGNLMSTSQTGIGLAVQFGLYPEDTSQRRVAAKALERLVRNARFTIGTGFAGTPVISHALTSIGKPQLAYRMLLETQCPSWLYAIVSHNATTIWERWDSMLKDGSINPGQMTSFNHYALGAVADWLHGTVGGISPLEPGWRTFRVRPVPGGNLTFAKVAFEGPHGRVACEWTWDAEGRFEMTLTVPPNSSAIVTLPSELRQDYGAVETEASRTVRSGVHVFDCVFDAGEWPPKPLIAANQSMPPDTIAE